MKYILILLVFFISSCAHVAPTFLEGEWKSNKELTISHFTSNKALTKEKKGFLERNLGELVIIFKGNKTTIYFEKPSEIEWGTFKVVNQTKSSFTILVTNSIVKAKEFTYTWSENCFYLEQKDYGYNEYFCKVGKTI